MDSRELWVRACELLKRDLNGISYSTFIEGNLSPVSLENDVLTLKIAMEQMKLVVENRYKAQIANCLSQVAGRRIEVEIVGQSEMGPEQTEEKTTVSYVQLNPRYTFDTFVVGAGNRFAHAASVAVAENPAEVYNPLFIHGGVGLGKTHLMHAIGHYVQEQYPEKRLLYITSETFVNELISAIQQGRNIEFRNRFRNVDILMVDDIQFIAGKDSTQDEFFHTFNELHNAGKQIILTSDKPPQEINRLEDRLRSRFAWGLIADIQKPDIETRIAILRAKALSDGVQVPDEVFSLIADHVSSNIRELEGSFNRLLAYAQLMGEPITVDLCATALQDTLRDKHRQVISSDLIMQKVCDYFGIRKEDLISSSRRREIAVPRQIAMYLTRELTDMSLPHIGAEFGNRDHSTVLHSYNLVARSVKDNDNTAAQVEDLRQLILET